MQRPNEQQQRLSSWAINYYGLSWTAKNVSLLTTGLHKLWYPGIRDRSTWGKFGAHGEHGDVFLFSNLGAL